MAPKLRLISGVVPIVSPEEEKAKYQKELLETYKSLLPVRYAQSTIPNFGSALGHYLPWLAENGLYLWEVLPKQYDVFSRHLQANIEKSTLVNYNFQLSSLYEWLVSRNKQEIVKKYGITPVNPIDEWNTPKKKYDEDDLPELPDPEVVNYYFQRARQEFSEALAAGKARVINIIARQLTAEKIMLEAGLRVEEVENLNVGHIHLEEMLIFVYKGKGDKDRIVDIQPSLAPMLKWYFEQGHPMKKEGKRLDPSLPLFMSEQKKRISKKTIQHRLWEQQIRYNVPVDKLFSAHGLRRLYATNLYVALVEEKHCDPLTYIKGQLGHAFYSTTTRYCRIPKAVIARAKNDAVASIKKELLGISEE